MNTKKQRKRRSRLPSGTPIDLVSRYRVLDDELQHWLDVERKQKVDKVAEGVQKLWDEIGFSPHQIR